MKLESVERRIQEKTQEAVGTPREQQGVLKDELKVLQVGRDKLKKQRDILDGRLKDGSILSTQEERRSVLFILADPEMNLIIFPVKEIVYNTRKVLGNLSDSLIMPFHD